MIYLINNQFMLDFHFKNPFNFYSFGGLKLIEFLISIFFLIKRSSPEKNFTTRIYLNTTLNIDTLNKQNQWVKPPTS